MFNFTDAMYVGLVINIVGFIVGGCLLIGIFAALGAYLNDDDQNGKQ